MQRDINFWFSSSLDLFGAEISSNAASYFAGGLTGRPDEARFADHVAIDQRLGIEVPDAKGGVRAADVPMRNAMNEVTRAAYVRDCDVGVHRWNRLVAEAGYDFRFRLPSTRFHRSIGVWSGVPTDPEGRPITDEEMAPERARLVAVGRGSRLCRQPDAACHRAAQGGGMDRPARKSASTTHPSTMSMCG